MIQGADMSFSEQIHRSQQSARERALDDDWVMSFAQWCQVNNFSPATGRRLRKVGKGPKITQISDRRIGITVRDNRLWQESRAKAAACGPGRPRKNASSS
jgi:hypothetical protein